MRRTVVTVVGCAQPPADSSDPVRAQVRRYIATMGKLDYGKAERNSAGYEQAFPGSKKREKSFEQWQETQRLTARPWLGLEDPRCEGYTVVEYGRLVRVVGRPC